MPRRRSTPDLISGIQGCLERHPYSGLCSQYDLPKDLPAMAESIGRDGLLSPITLHQGKVLDGWNRLQGCIIAGVAPRFEDLAPGLDPWEFVKAKNLLRRHLSPSERFAVLAAKVELDRKEKALAGECSKLNTPSVREIAKELHVSIGTAHKAAKILRANDPELTAAVAGNCISMEDGAEIADRPEPEHREAMNVARANAARPRTPGAQTPTPRVQSLIAVEALEATINGQVAKIRNLAWDLDVKTVENNRLQSELLALQKEVAELNTIITAQKEENRQLSEVLAEALEANALLKAKAVPDVRDRIEDAVVEDPELDEDVMALAAVDETPGDIQAQVEDSIIQASEVPPSNRSLAQQSRRARERAGREARAQGGNTA